MRFKLVPDFTEADMEKDIQKFLDRIFRILKSELNNLGLEMVSDARLRTKSEGGFDDQTGNLRSSIFCSLSYNSEVLFEDFQPSSRGTDKDTGIEQAKSFAEQTRNENKDGWVLIIGAGMDYARYVEAKGYSVISGSTLGLDKKLEAVLKNVVKAMEDIK